MNISPEISIITPNYNYGQFIRSTIESVVGQDYTKIEHIIIDDGSTDNSVNVIKSCQVKYPNKIFLIEQTNNGQTNAINNGLKNANGDVLGWLNSDDTYCRDTLSLVAEVFANHPEIDIVFGNVNIVDGNNNFIYQKRHLRFDYYSACFLGFTTVLTSNAVFWRSKLTKKHGLLNEAFRCNMDGDYFSRIAPKAAFFHLNRPLANFRKQPYSKAAEKDEKWSETVRNEFNNELFKNYSTLWCAKIIPYKASKPLMAYYRTKRIIKRTLLLHYVKQYLEKRRYKMLCRQL